MRMLCIVGWLVTLSGCAQDIEAPAAVGAACDSDMDCRSGNAACGLVLSCLDGRCERAGGEPALSVPCLDNRRIVDDEDAGVPRDTDAG